MNGLGDWISRRHWMLSRTIGTIILRLADADVLPFEFTATARTLRGYVDDIEKARKDLVDDLQGGVVLPPVHHIKGLLNFVLHSGHG